MVNLELFWACVMAIVIGVIIIVATIKCAESSTFDFLMVLGGIFFLGGIFILACYNWDEGVVREYNKKCEKLAKEREEYKDADSLLYYAHVKPYIKDSVTWYEIVKDRLEDK